MNKRTLAGIAAIAFAGTAVAGTGAHAAGGTTHHTGAAMSGTYGAATLMPMKANNASGAMILMPDQSGKKGMTAALFAQYLKPKTSYSVTLSHGMCSSNGTTSGGSGSKSNGNLPMLPSATTDSDGSFLITATLSGMSSVPASGMSVVVRPASSGSSGSSSSSGSNSASVCGNIHRAEQVIRLGSINSSQASGWGLITRHVSSDGTTSSSAKGTEVVTYVANVGSHAVHAEHLHAGRCGDTGQIMYPLADLEGAPNSEALASTYLDLTVPMSGLYLNVHGTNLIPVACGNL